MVLILPSKNIQMCDSGELTVIIQMYIKYLSLVKWHGGKLMIYLNYRFLKGLKH